MRILLTVYHKNLESLLQKKRLFLPLESPATNFCVEDRGDRGPRDFKPRGDGEYRRHDDKKAGAAGDFNPQFRGGVGRGAPAS